MRAWRIYISCREPSFIRKQAKVLLLGNGPGGRSHGNAPGSILPGGRTNAEFHPRGGGGPRCSAVTDACDQDPGGRTGRRSFSARTAPPPAHATWRANVS